MNENNDHKSPRPFWLVSGEGECAVCRRFNNKNAAHDEAKRLCRMHPGKHFYVTESELEVFTIGDPASVLSDVVFIINYEEGKLSYGQTTKAMPVLQVKTKSPGSI